MFTQMHHKITYTIKNTVLSDWSALGGNSKKKMKNVTL